MNDHDGMLAAICDDPRDDTVRLAYADLLDERGWKGDRERAEFIRVQVELAKCPTEAIGTDFIAANRHTYYDLSAARDENPARERLQRREMALLQMMVPKQGHGKGYTAPRINGRAFFSECGCPLAGLSLRRGFLEQITVTTENFMAHAAGIFTRHPVERVTLVGKNPFGQLQSTTAEAWGWEFIMASAPPRSCDIPLELWRPLKPYRLGEEIGQHGWYASDQEARQALSNAAVVYGRETAAKAREGAVSRS